MTPNALNRRSMLTGGTLISLGTCSPHAPRTTPRRQEAQPRHPAQPPPTAAQAPATVPVADTAKADERPRPKRSQTQRPRNGYRARPPTASAKPWTPGTSGLTTASKPATTAIANSLLDKRRRTPKSTGEIEALYRRGGWVIDGIQYFKPRRRALDRGRPNLPPENPPHEWDKETDVDPDGAKETWSSDKQEETYIFALEHRDGRWQILYSQIDV